MKNLLNANGILRKEDWTKEDWKLYLSFLEKDMKDYSDLASLLHKNILKNKEEYLEKKINFKKYIEKREIFIQAREKASNEYYKYTKEFSILDNEYTKKFKTYYPE